MAEYNFKKDLIIGEDGENDVITDLISIGGEFVSSNKDNKYDAVIKFKDELITYEIKTDVFCKPTRDSKNMFIEFECRGKESGVRVTQAKWFVTYYKFLGEIWYIETSILKHLIAKSNFYTTAFSGDDGSNTKGYLIPRIVFKKHFIVRKIKSQ